MHLITLLIAAIGSLLIFVLSPIQGLMVYCGGLFLYPQYLTMPIGTIDFSVARVLILLYWANIIAKTRLLNNFRINKIDILLILFTVMKFFSSVLHEPFSRAFEHEAGQFFETALPYFALRVTITSKEDIIRLIRAIAIIAVPIAFAGMLQWITGFNVYGFTKPFNAWVPTDQVMLVRHGLFRADVSFGNYIAYGMFFASIAPMALGMYHPGQKHRYLMFGLLAILTIGVATSMSSGPLFSFAISCLMLAIYPWRRHWRIFVFVAISGILFLQFYSNRSWYEVLTRFAFSGDTAYYRIGLLKEALGGGMTGHWLTGYGYVGIGSDKPIGYFNWEHQDFTNIYILYLAKYGLIALIPYLFINVLYYRRLTETYRLASPSDHWLIWCFASALVGWNTSMMTVAPLAQTSNLLLMYIALCVNFPRAIASHRAATIASTMAWKK